MLAVGGVIGLIAALITGYRWGYFADIGVGAGAGLLGGILFANYLAAGVTAIGVLLAVHLWKTVGVVVSVLAIFGVQLARVLLSVSSGGVERQLADSAATYNKGLPRMVNTDVRLERVDAGPGKTLTYFYTIVSGTTRDISWPEVAPVLRRSLVDRTCASQARSMIDAGVAITQHFADRNGAALGDIAIAAQDCPRLTQ